jgi:uncharacterized YigZ family protein
LKTTQNTNEAKIEIKKSRFISFLCPYDQFEDLRAKLQQEHCKAAHIVWAYRYMNEFEQIVENSTDNGEPKNTSGKPTLQVLRGNDLINVAILTVRYFGGIMLGTGGLVKAYTQAAQEVVKNTSLENFSPLITTNHTIGITDFAKFEHTAKKEGKKILMKSFLGEKVIVTVQETKNKH